MPAPGTYPGLRDTGLWEGSMGPEPVKDRKTRGVDRKVLPINSISILVSTRF